MFDYPKDNRGGHFRDQLRLLFSALLLIAFGGGVLLNTNIYSVGPAWFFFAWSAALLVPMVGRYYRHQFKNWRFLFFLAAWMCFHGAVVASLFGRVKITYWIPIIFCELVVGSTAVVALFGPPRRNANQSRFPDLKSTE